MSQEFSGTTSGGSGGGVIIAAIMLVLVFSGPIFGSLYPLASGAALVAGLATNAVLSISARGLSPEGRLPLSMLAALVVFWPMMRLDYRLATFPPYRIARHIVRVVLIGSYFALVTFGDSGGRWLPTSIAQVRWLVTDQTHLVALVIGAIIGHLVLTRAKRIGARWSSALELVRLRPADREHPSM